MSQALRAVVTRHSQIIYEFGPFRLDAAKRLLLRDGEVAPLTPKCVEILLMLVENSGQVVDKEGLMNRVWPDSFVEEGNLTYNISVLRKALGERANEHLYIVTVPGRGYRFVAGVTEVSLEGTERTAQAPSESGDALNGAVPAEGRHETEAESRKTAALGLVDEDAHANPTKHEAVNWQARIAQHKFVFGAVALTIIALLGAAAYFRFRGNKPMSISKVAVLPLANLSGDPDMEYLSDGVSESLINALSQLPAMKVIARNSSFKYKGKEIDPRELAKLLEVEALVMGSVGQRGDNLSINVELMDVRDGTQIWGEQYNRRKADLLQVQSEICREIAYKLRLHLTTGEQQQIVRREATNPLAYELLLRGRACARKGGTENRLRGIEFFNQAIAVDPDYARAYASLSLVYGALSSVDPKEYTPKALAAAEKALQLDENLAEAHLAKANLHRDAWDWQAAEAEYRRAIDLNPNLSPPRAHSEYSDYLRCMGRFDQALEEITRSRELDPLNPFPNASLANILVLARRYDEALIQTKKTLELDNSFAETYYLLGVIYTAKGMYREAMDSLKEFDRLGGVEPGKQLYLGAAYADAGEAGKARVILKQLRTTKEHVSEAGLAMLYASLGERENAFASLEKAYAAHDEGLQFLKVTPQFDPLRSDPRFQDLMRRVGLPQ